MENLQEFSLYTKVKKTSIILNNSTEERVKNNTARFKLIPSRIENNRKYYDIFFPIKLFITSTYDFFNISGTIEVNLSISGHINVIDKSSFIHNKKITYISDTRRTTKYYYIDFQVIDEEMYLIFKYNNRNNRFDIKIFSDVEIESPKISNEDISEIQDWY